jgi:hypothetical protein
MMHNVVNFKAHGEVRDAAGAVVRFYTGATMGATRTTPWNAAADAAVEAGHGGGR